MGMVESATVKSLYLKVRQADVPCHRTRTNETGQYLWGNGTGKSENYQKNFSLTPFDAAFQISDGFNRGMLIFS